MDVVEVLCDLRFKELDVVFCFDDIICCFKCFDIVKDLVDYFYFGVDVLVKLCFIMYFLINIVCGILDFIRI